MKILNAEKTQSKDIARLIMEAMNADCCQYFAGPRHTLDDFHQMMTRLVEQDETQYSYRNTLVAVSDEGTLMGICVMYDGGQLHRLRQAFVQAARCSLGRDFSEMADETQAGELYLDSLAVKECYRGRGIATALLRASADRAKAMGIPAVGLLVDKGNPAAEHLYRRVGFEYVNDSMWGGHPMRHLQLKAI